MVIIAVAVFLTSIIIAHIFAPRGYSWTTDTVSQLAASTHPQSWILRAGLISYGIILILATSELSVPSILIAAYGLGVIFTGIFNVERHSFIHLVSIYSAGIALTAAMIWLAAKGDKVSILCLIVMLSAELLFNIKALGCWRGLTQRIVHLTTLIWLTAYSISL